MWGLARSLGAEVRTFRLRTEASWEPDWEEFERAVTSKTKLLYISNPNNPTGSVLSRDAMEHIVERCDRTGTWLLADEVYLGAELGAPRTPSFWGMSERVIVTSGLSKAYGIPGVRIGWLVGPPPLAADCWSQHDYITICPSKLSDRVARVAVEARVRERCYARTSDILQENVVIADDWVRGFAGRLAWTPPRAGAIGLVKYTSDTPSAAIAERIRVNQSTLIVPGSYVGIEGHLRVWLGARREFLREGLRRIGTELTALFD
jgi:aspartate/methionine/tyrosine aminotransferase